MNSIMKKLLIPILLLSIVIANAQEVEPKNTADFKLGNGLNFSFNEGAYQFNIGGFVQPIINYEKIKGADSEFEFNSRRTFFILSGKAVNEKVSFLIQNDFSLSKPLLDAWIAYHPYEWLTITGGQKQTFVNNREMTYREDKLQFTDRSVLSRTFSNTGREFGLFLEGKFGEKIGIAPKFAVTSGDGRNSFGADSRDADIGGLKVGGRLDIYPLGYFIEGNDLFTADLAHEQQLKLIVGGAVSQNKGASNANGEGHGDFFFYDSNGKESLPDYSQVFADLLMKYKGFSFLFEYANASATNLGTPYLDVDATSILAPQEVSEYLILGDSFSLQTGYVTLSGFSFDVRYENSKPEFTTNNNSLLQESDSYTFGITKYFDKNNLKVQAAIQSTEFKQGSKITTAELLFQLVF